MCVGVVLKGVVTAIVMQSLSVNIHVLESFIDRMEAGVCLSGLESKKERNTINYEKSPDFYVNEFLATSGTEEGNSQELITAIVFLNSTLKDADIWTLTEKIGKMIYRNKNFINNSRCRTMIISEERLTPAARRGIYNVFWMISIGHSGNFR